MNIHDRDRFTVCPAHVGESGDLENLVAIAGDGLPLHTWDALIETGDSAMDVGQCCAVRSESAFSYHNADVALRHDRVLSAIISYPMKPLNLPAPSTGIPPIFQPIVALENQAIGSWYINILVSYPDARRQGAASALLAEVQNRALEAGYTTLSLIVSNVNPAQKFYEKQGFNEADRALMAKDGQDNAGQEWVLMTKTIA